MIYGNLARVNQIDTQIDDLHEHLSNLYAERRKLMNSKLPAVSPSAPQVTASTDEINEMYQILSTRWSSFGVKVPAAGQLKSRLIAARQLADRLEAENYLLADSLRIVVVPPQKVLQTALSRAPDRLQLAFAEPELQQMTGPKIWQVIVVINRQLTVNSTNFKQFIEEKEYQYEGLDCRALGLTEFLAAGLQTGDWPADDQWLLLLKDQMAKQVLCVAKHDRQLMVDIDSTDALLGRNYFQPAILIKTPPKKRAK